MFAEVNQPIIESIFFKNSPLHDGAAIIKGNQVYFLELNSIPGMSEESIIQKQVRSMGLTMPDVLQEVIDEVMGI